MPAGDRPTSANDPIHSSPAVPLAADASTPPITDLRQIFEQANRIASTAGLEDLLQQMLDLMVQVAGGSNGTFYLHDPEAHELIFSVIRGSPEDQILTGTRMRDDKGIVGDVITTQQPTIIEDLANDPRWFREIHPELTARLRNAITLPLLLQGRAVGAVQIFNYLRVDVELLQLLANRMASEVDKALLLEKSRAKNIRLQMLIESLAEMTALLDRDQVLNSLTGCASKLVDAQNSSVFLVDSTHEEGAQWLSHSSRSGYRDTHRPVPGELHQSPSRFQAGSTISVPLRSRPINAGKDRRGSDARVIGNLISMNKLNGAFTVEDSHLLEILASHAGTLLQVSFLFNQSNEMLLEFTKALAAAIDAKEPFTRGHSQRVSEYGVEIARRVGLSSDELMDIRIGGLLHDIGKLNVPDYILAKPGTLSDEEFEEIKKHPGKGLKILEMVHPLRSILPAVVEHHERLDGSGYPHGLYGDQISMMGRIIAVSDVFDALTTDRPYRKAMVIGDVLDFFEQNRNHRFDSDCVEALSQYTSESDGRFYPVD